MIGRVRVGRWIRELSNKLITELKGNFPSFPGKHPSQNLNSLSQRSMTAATVDAGLLASFIPWSSPCNLQLRQLLGRGQGMCGHGHAAVSRLMLKWHFFLCSIRGHQHRAPGKDHFLPKTQAKLPEMSSHSGRARSHGLSCRIQASASKRGGLRGGSP